MMLAGPIHKTLEAGSSLAKETISRRVPTQKISPVGSV
jgi:hypothetical protein